MTSNIEEIIARSVMVPGCPEARYDPDLITYIEAPLDPPQSTVLAFARWLRDAVRRMRGKEPLHRRDLGDGVFLGWR